MRGRLTREFLPPRGHSPSNPVSVGAPLRDMTAAIAMHMSPHPITHPALLQLCLLLPCEARDAETQVKKHLGHDRFPYASAVVAVCPQPSRAFAAFVTYPEWVAQAHLSTVLLDLRLAALQGRGPVISAYLPRPATAADVRKKLASTRWAIAASMLEAALTLAR